jgi:Ca2+-binding EF-hand superfamily protein
MTTGAKRNSAIRLYKYNKRTYELLDYEEFISDIKENNLRGSLDYKLSYSFKNEYNSDGLSPTSVLRVINSFKTNNTLWNKYLLNTATKYYQPVCENDCRVQRIDSMIKKND